jgi:ketosteroid isomerase-like protein
MTRFAEAEAGIRQLHARYTDATWRKDAESFARCFTPDGEWRISGMVLRGRPQIAETIERILARINRVLLTFRTPVLDVGQGVASGRTMIDENVSWADGRSNISIGRYYERFVEHEGCWYFTWRLFQLHYSGPPDLTGAWYEHDDYGPPPGMPPLDAVSLDTSSLRWQLPEGYGKT